ncbi:hypothetical protein Tco_0767988 [Tanacetum coccineum]
MINQQPNATEITGNMSPNFWKFNNVSPNGVFGNKARYGVRILEIQGYGGGLWCSMVVKWGKWGFKKEVFGSLDPRILTTLSSCPKALEIVCVRCMKIV